MQNVVNLHAPFLYNGEPIVNGRVYFVKDDTSALTFDQVVLPQLIKSTYKTYFQNIPLFMRVRKRFDAEKIRKIE